MMSTSFEPSKHLIQQLRWIVVLCPDIFGCYLPPRLLFGWIFGLSCAILCVCVCVCLCVAH